MLVVSWVSWHSQPHSTVISLSPTAFWIFVELLNSGWWPSMCVSVKSQHLSNKSLFAMNSPTIAPCFAASHPKERRFYVCLKFSHEGCFHFFIKKKYLSTNLCRNFLDASKIQYLIYFIWSGLINQLHSFSFFPPKSAACLHMHQVHIAWFTGYSTRFTDIAWGITERTYSSELCHLLQGGLCRLCNVYTIN